MTNSKNTKKSLYASAVALLLCFVMLIGTTFAWFTDSASTGVNTIVAGNLDIALFAGDVNDEGDIVWDTNETDKNTKLFNDKALWEPGYTEVAYLKVENKGDLAVKYALAAHFASQQYALNSKGERIYLADYLKYDVVELDQENPVAFATREAARSAATKDIQLTSDGTSRMDWNGTLVNKGDARYYAVIVYMPTEVGNEANFDAEKSNGIAPSIELGINLVATQDNVESDSFDENYDANATMPTIEGIPNKPAQEIVEVGTLKDLQEAFENVSESTTDIVININKNITLKSGEVWKTYAAPVGTKNVTINGNGSIITGLNAPLMTGVWGGHGKITINNLTLSGSTIKEPSYGDMGVGAFVSYIDASGSLELNDCHLLNSSVEATTERAGGLLGYSSAESIQLINCSVVNSIITADQDAAALVGCSQSKATIKNCKVEKTTIVSKATDKCRTGYLVANITGGPVLFENVSVDKDTKIQQTWTGNSVRAHDYFGRVYDIAGVTIK